MLRLRSVEDYNSLHFDPLRMRRSVESRISSFQQLIAEISSPDDIFVLKHIQERLIPFGYSLFLKTEIGSSSDKSDFSGGSGGSDSTGGLGVPLHKNNKFLLTSDRVTSPLGRVSSPTVFDKYDIMKM